MAVSKNHRFSTTLTLLFLLATGCSWREVSPRMASPPNAKVGPAIAVRPVDRETAIADLDGISRRLKDWGATEMVFFPYRSGDATDLFLDVRLRQTNDSHTFANVMRGVAIGLTFGLLSPVIGANLTEVHDVEVQVTRAGRVIGKHHFEMRTELYVGLGANTQAAAKDLDEEQMNRIAKRIVELVAEDIRKSSAPASRVSFRVTSSL